MAAKKCFLIIVVIMAVTQQIHTACVCKAKGTDGCAASSKIRVVEPSSVLRKKPDIKLPTTGDNCWCSKTMVQPAPLPKPYPEIHTACDCKAKETDGSAASSKFRVVAPSLIWKKPEIKPPPIGDNCWCSKTMVQPAPLPKPCPETKEPAKSYSASIFNYPYAAPQNIYKPALAKDYSLPADPISISLAAQAGKAIQVPEAKLAYGFVQKPIDGQPKVYTSSINEENLYAMKSGVITLNKSLQPKVKYIEDDYPEPEDEETAHEEHDPPSLTYKQLGYVTEHFKNPQFQKVPSAWSYSSHYAPSALPDKLDVDCGFRPERISKRC